MNAKNLETFEMRVNDLEADVTTNLELVPEVQKLKVRDIMTVEDIKVYENDQVASAYHIMNWEGLKHVCVFNESNELVGTLHFDDVRGARNQEKSVSEIMHKKFQKIFGYLDAEIGKKAVVTDRDHCLPVFENKQIIGILNIEDIFQYHQFN